MNCELRFLKNLRTIFETYGTLQIFLNEKFLLVRDVTLSEKNAENDVPKDPFFTGHSLVTHSQGKKIVKTKTSTWKLRLL